MWPFGNHKPLGQKGESIARRFLKRSGLKILAENFRCASGEIDLIALDKSTRKTDGVETLCFVEVKTRSSDRYTDPESAVDNQKQVHIQKAARYYLSNRDTDGFNVRFDVVSVIMRQGQKPEIRHIKEAF